jgi:hypothetical protein
VFWFQHSGAKVCVVIWLESITSELFSCCVIVMWGEEGGGDCLWVWCTAIYGGWIVSRVSAYAGYCFFFCFIIPTSVKTQAGRFFSWNMVNFRQRLPGRLCKQPLINFVLSCLVSPAMTCCELKTSQRLVHNTACFITSATGKGNHPSHSLH